MTVSLTKWLRPWEGGRPLVTVSLTKWLRPWVPGREGDL